MPRGISAVVSSFKASVEGNRANEESIFKTITLTPHNTIYPQERWTEDRTPLSDVDYLIDATDYESSEDPEDVPYEDKVFLTYRKNADGTHTLRQMDLEELIAAQPSPEGSVFEEKPEPKLQGLDWLRHMLKSIFGEPEVLEAYERQKEVTRAKRIQNLNEKYGLEIPYNRDLVDEEKAKSYVATGSTVPQKKAVTGKKASAEPKKKAIRHPEKFDVDQAKIDLAKTLLKNTTRPGAANLANLIDSDPNAVKGLIDVLATYQMHLDPPENSKLGKLSAGDNFLITSNLNAICKYAEKEKNLPVLEQKIKHGVPTVAFTQKILRDKDQKILERSQSSLSF